MVLAELLERTEAATGPDDDLDFAITQLADPRAVKHSSAHLHYTASVDASLSLVERMLPGSRLQLTRDPDLDGWWARFADDPNSVQGATAALAILAALLRASPPLGAIEG